MIQIAVDMHIDNLVSDGKEGLSTRFTATLLGRSGDSSAKITTSAATNALKGYVHRLLFVPYNDSVPMNLYERATRAHMDSRPWLSDFYK